MFVLFGDNRNVCWKRFQRELRLLPGFQVKIYAAEVMDFMSSGDVRVTISECSFREDQVLVNRLVTKLGTLVGTWPRAEGSWQFGIEDFVMHERIMKLQCESLYSRPGFCASISPMMVELEKLPFTGVKSKKRSTGRLGGIHVKYSIFEPSDGRVKRYEHRRVMMAFRSEGDEVVDLYIVSRLFKEFVKVRRAGYWTVSDYLCEFDTAELRKNEFGRLFF